MQFGYGLNYLIDIAHAIIVDVEPHALGTQLLTRLRRQRPCSFVPNVASGLKPKRLAADTAYGTAKFHNWLIGARIAPHIPVWDKSDREDGTLSRSDFRWDRRQGVYICPTGKVLHTTGKVHEGYKLRYRASKFDCESLCPQDASRLPQSAVTRAAPRCSWNMPAT